MFDIALVFRLAFSAFSLERESPRFPSLKRILSVCFLMPVLLLLVLVNRFFMLLDWIFFPHFSRTKIVKPLFIVGIPRSATTFLFDTLASDTEQFTAVKLWEMVFAPSILQKLFYLAIIRTDRIIGRPLYRLSRLADRLLFSRMQAIHPLSFSHPEEDEMLLVYAMSTMMLVFSFPGTEAMSPLLFFDAEMPEAKKKRIMRFYRRSIQRHLFVFGRNGRRTYLSKNPCFVSKMESLARTFPDSRLLYLLRSPEKTIPSTISLNAGLYSLFSKRTKSLPLIDETRDTLVRWYTMADRSLKRDWNERGKVIPFRAITGEPAATVLAIYDFAGKKMPGSMRKRMEKQEAEKQVYRSAHAYDPAAGLADGTYRESLRFIFEGPWAGQI